MGLVLSAFSTVFAAEESHDAYMFEDVIVTATKRETNVQQTPVAISALDDDMLNSRGIIDSYSLQDSIPGMVTAFTDNRAYSGIWIRGIGDELSVSGAEPGVAFHMDGVYQQNPFASGQPIFDMERIEVLRGPQGTLYGRNATGGAINYVTKKPTSEFEFSGDVLMGDYDRIRTRGAVNIPIMKDKLHFRGAWQTNDRDGYAENIWTGNPADPEDSRAVRAHLHWLITPDIDVLLSYTREDFKGGRPSLNIVGNYQGGTINPGYPNLDPWGTGNVYAGVLPIPADRREVRWDTDNQEEAHFDGFYVKLNWDLGKVVASSLTAHHTLDYNYISDLDLSELSIQNMVSGRTSDQWVQEFQLTSNFEGPFEFVAGLFYFNDESDDFGHAPGLLLDDYGWSLLVDNTSYAGYAHGSYAITDKFKLTGGIRYTKDEKTSHETLQFPFVFFMGPDFLGSGLFWPVVTDLEQEWEEITWKGGIEYQLTDQNFLYASVSRGYKGGGMTILSTTIFDPEYILSYEVGSKNRFLDNRAQVNISAYYSDYTDLQLMVWEQITRVVTNAAEATIQGFELELLLRPIGGLALDGSVAFIDATFDEYFDEDPSDPTDTVQDLSGNRISKTPEWTVKLGAQYTVDMGDWGFLTPRIDFYWQDEYYARQFNKPVDLVDGYSKTDVKLIYESPEGKWYAQLFVRHIEDNEVVVARDVSSGQFGSLIRDNLASPRTVGFMVGVKF